MSATAICQVRQLWGWVGGALAWAEASCLLYWAWGSLLGVRVIWVGHHLCWAWGCLLGARVTCGPSPLCWAWGCLLGTRVTCGRSPLCWAWGCLLGAGVTCGWSPLCWAWSCEAGAAVHTGAGCCVCGVWKRLRWGACTGWSQVSGHQQGRTRWQPS